MVNKLSQPKIIIQKKLTKKEQPRMEKFTEEQKPLKKPIEQELEKEQALELKLPWKDKDDKEYKPQSYEVPANISEVNDDVCKQILACTECGKNYKIIPQELKFYKEQIVPVPKKCPDCRHLDRMKLRNPRILYKRQCAKCNQDMHTTYSKDKPETVYCQECYKKEVY